MFSFFRNEYLSWDAYEKKAKFHSRFHFQQHVRKENIRNSPFF